jgi:hypothetical protein
MPITGWHAGRVRDPSLFLKKPWATTILKPGLELITGKLKSDGPNGPMTAQTYHFDSDKFTVDQAKEWLKKHKIKTIEFSKALPKKKEVKEIAAEIVSELCSTPGMKIRSKGKGRGLARGKGRGPIGIPIGAGIKETSMLANIAARVTEKCWGSAVSKKKKKSEVTEQKGQAIAISNGSPYRMKGSYEALRDMIRKALENSQLYGKYPEILSTYPKKVFISGGNGKDDEYWMVDYTIQGDEAKLGIATPIERQVKFIIKESAEECMRSLFGQLTEATWTAASINDLPDDAFAYIESGGKKDASGKTVPRSLRHFPLKDKNGKYDQAHVVNALQRLNQTTVSDSAKASIKSKIKTAYHALKMVFPGEKKEQASNPDREAFIAGLASAALKGIFEGGPGSGNWGHGGRPGKRGGSLPHGSAGAREVAKKKSAGNKILALQRTLRGYQKDLGKASGKSKKDIMIGITKIKKDIMNIKGGIKASTFYNKSGALKTSEYKKLSNTEKESVLQHGISKYKEQYVPKANQGGMSAEALGSNKKVGALEGMRRAAIAKSKGSSGKEYRAAMHVAISLQQRSNQLAGSIKSAGANVLGATSVAVKTAQAQPGR